MSDTEARRAQYRVEAYLETVKRLEPDIAIIDQGASLASISISLKRIADLLTDIKVILTLHPPKEPK